MLTLKNIVLIYILGVIGFCKANITDYLKGTDRTFNAIEGKIVDVNITMKEQDFQTFMDQAQLSIIEYYMNYHAEIPEHLEFKTKVSVNMTVDNETQNFEKVEFKIGGSYSRTHAKLGFNLKLKQPFLGRKNIRLRADYYDLTRIRSKLTSDLMNRWGMPSIQESFAQLYINGERFGLYFIMDAIKPNWIKAVYELPEEEEVKTLYYCDKMGMDFSPESIKSCSNEKSEYANYTQPLIDFASEIYNYTTVKQLKTKIDVDNFRKTMISEYLFGNFDNFIIAGHNLHYYLQPNGIWQLLTHDYDTTFISQIDFTLQYMPIQMPRQNNTLDYISVKFDDFHSPGINKPFVDVLYHKDQKTFKKVLKEMLITGFNPDELFPRIDELVKFIAPYAEKDLIPNENGRLPGEINVKGQKNNVTMEIFWESIEDGNYFRNVGLKQFIQIKFDAVCKHYGFNKKAILREAAIYRKKRELEIKIKEIKEEIAIKKQQLVESLKKVKEIKQAIESLTKKLNSLTKEYRKY